tara:strand:+ start:673 stop:1365 length:693 start_codon:yes stop_codon:yes gene_type:complete
MRDSARSVKGYASQLKMLKESLAKLEKEPIELVVSAYENDSIDDTVKNFKAADFSFIDKLYFEHEVLFTKRFGSTQELERVRNLANARNKTIEIGMEDIKDCNAFVSIEIDITYNPAEYAQLIVDARDYDILSGASLYRRDKKLYDKWATRRNEKDQWWDEGHLGVGVQEVYSTYNSFCVYNPKPIVEGVRYGYRRGSTFDCDTAVICRNFREAGYHKISIDFEKRCSQW